jgi:hypothetical protein
MQWLGSITKQKYSPMSVCDTLYAEQDSNKTIANKQIENKSGVNISKQDSNETNTNKQEDEYIIEIHKKLFLLCNDSNSCMISKHIRNREDVSEFYKLHIVPEKCVARYPKYNCIFFIKFKRGIFTRSKNPLHGSYT